MKRNIERNKEIYDLHCKGETVRDLSNRFGLSFQRIQQICAREDERRKIVHVAPTTINKPVLLSCIVRVGDNMRDAAAKLGCKYVNFIRKMSGDAEFTVSEMNAIREIYHISDYDFALIFLNAKSLDR